MRVSVTKHVIINGGRYNSLRLEAAVELTDEDLDYDDDDQRDPIDAGLDRAMTAVNDALGPELELIKQNHIAEDHQWITRVIKTITADQGENP
jgi:glycine cleavage system aminomethyltransferase T